MPRARRLRPKVLVEHAAMWRAQESAATDPSYADFARSLAEGFEKQLAEAGRCRQCGRPLELPESVARGIGPCCEAKLHQAAAEVEERVR